MIQKVITIRVGYILEGSGSPTAFGSSSPIRFPNAIKIIMEIMTRPILRAIQEIIRALFRLDLTMIMIVIEIEFGYKNYWI